MTDTLSPREALLETCPDCNGSCIVSQICGGGGVSWGRCDRCNGTGRALRTTHEPASGIGNGIAEKDVVDLERIRVLEGLLRELLAGVHPHVSPELLARIAEVLG